nr:GAF domain-containing protein [Kibdelosporangium sp. MJ126-NF4]CEL13963.1 GGDEF family protein VCA0785 [imported], putative [Kibdelosporangium sp. MJ126-NF4]CTQ88332.1 GGDEF family protein VCA0785 [imported], putative [Kibdelosporangium sp. MJ126-NF4]
MADTSENLAGLSADLDEAARRIGAKSVLVMRSTPTHMRVEASAGESEAVYPVGAEGRKHGAFPEAKELYCERVVDTAQPLFVRDSRDDPEFAGNEDEVEFGLVNYVGIPLTADDGTVIGTVCALHDTPRDYSAEDIGALERLRDQAQRALRDQP